MNTEMYEAWRQSHRTQPCHVDLSDAIMRQIHHKASQPCWFKRICRGVQFNGFQARALARAGALSLGALLGTLRLLFQIYSLLFS
ncbi:MAG: hypothetical protein K9N55_04650 [Phycisphaerae bacterium]|nr:hypothetical protein [Phycisphaerae bacterium]